MSNSSCRATQSKTLSCSCLRTLLAGAVCGAVTAIAPVEGSATGAEPCAGRVSRTAARGVTAAGVVERRTVLIAVLLNAARRVVEGAVNWTGLATGVGRGVAGFALTANGLATVGVTLGATAFTEAVVAFTGTTGDELKRTGAAVADTGRTTAAGRATGADGCATVVPGLPAGVVTGVHVTGSGVLVVVVEEADAGPEVAVTADAKTSSAPAAPAGSVWL